MFTFLQYCVTLKISKSRDILKEVHNEDIK